jgi:ABC-type nitrate/sulfonate/bicarbonate transport system substrate-binding protein
VKLSRWAPAALLAGCCLLLSRTAPAEEPFAKLVGDVKVGPVKAADVLEVPYLIWGGDVATFLANGTADETKKGTLFDQQGLKLKLTDGNDFVAQVKNYLEGKTPILRGTMSQLGQASEVLGKDPKTRPVVFLQLTWSAGDHMVARPSCKTLNDLKGKKIALQAFGPHVGMLDDILRSANLKWDDVKIVWTKDVTGPDGPVELFRKDGTVDACFAITPDMEGLTGGLDKEGTGAETTVKGAKVLVSTRTLTHSIADVYACRKDYYDANKATIEKFAAAYLKACEDLVEMKVNHDKKDGKVKALDDKYLALLKLTASIYGKEAIPDDDAAHGLIQDANFVALPGNQRFFKDKTDAVNFANRIKSAVDLAVSQGYAKERIEPLAADLDYANLKKLGGLKLEVMVDRTPAFVKPDKGEDEDFNFEKDTIFTFTIQFDSDEPKFDVTKYEKDFEKVTREAALYGNALFAVRGHVDPTRTLRQFVQGGLEKRLITREKVDTGWKYYKDGKEFPLADTKKVVEMIKKADFTGLEENPQPTLQAAQKLSEARAKSVREALIAFAKDKGVSLDASQFRSRGVGIEEPVIPVPKNPDEAAKNRRVEFRILKVSPEKLSAKDFDN